jgi:hypothetical protein
MPKCFLALLLAPIALLADPGQEVLDLFTSMATALSAGDATEFLRPLDRAMPRYRDLSANVTALVEQAEVLSSIEIVRNSGDAKQRTVELDWLLQVSSKQQGGPLERRHETVRCRLEKQKRGWRIVALEPVDFFAPSQIRR